MSSTQEFVPFALRFEVPLLAEQIDRIGKVVFCEETQGYIAMTRRPKKPSRNHGEISEDDLLEINGGFTATAGVTWRFAEYIEGAVQAAVSNAKFDPDS